MGSMEDHDYIPSERDRRWCEAQFSTSEGQKRLKHYRDENHRYIEWRIQHEGYVPPSDFMREHEKWRARHSDLCAKLDKRK